MTDDQYGKIHTDGSRSGGQPVVATQKAHTAMLEVLAEWGIEPRSATPRQLTVATTEALCRAIEQHETFKQEVSDAVEAYVTQYDASDWSSLKSFIIPKPKPDPLVEVCNAVGLGHTDTGDMADEFRAALDAFGFEIREKGRW